MNTATAIQPSGAKDLYTSMPGYLSAADNHNLANTGTSWLEPETYANAFGNAGKFIASSILSGANSFYQSGAAIGRWVGADIEESSTDSFISSIDSDLGAYYRANKEAADLTGFVLGSLIPGLAGVKLLNAGQNALKAAKAEGLIGGNLGKAMGILTPSTDKYVRMAATEINSSLSATSLLNAKTVQAIGAGAWQGVLETAAFETVVQATMFKSPILESQDIGDVMTNLGIGGVVGGVVGGVFTAPGVLGRLKRLVGQEKVDRLPFTERPSFASETAPSDRIIQLAYDSEMSAVPIVLRDAEGKLVSNTYNVDKSLYDDKLRKNFNDTRKAIHDLSGGDVDLGNMLANASSPMIDTATGTLRAGYSQGYLESFSGAVAVGRINQITKVEQELAAAIKAGRVTETNLSSRYVKMIGEDAGTVLENKPPLISLADKNPSQVALMREVAENKFTLKNSKQWSALELKGVNAHLEAEARQIWATHTLKLDWIKPTTILNEFDLPVLERVYLDPTKYSEVKIQRGSGPTLEVWTPGSREELYSLIKENKIETANQVLRKMSLDGSIPIEQGTEAAAKIANTRMSYLEGSPSAKEFDDLFASQAAHTSYLENLKAKGLTTSGNEVTDPQLLPKYAKVVYQVDKNVKDASPLVSDAVTFFKAQQKIYEQNAKIVAAKVLGPEAQNLPDITSKMEAAMDHAHAGPGFVSFANSNYGTWGSTMQWIGSQTRGLKEKFRQQVSDAVSGPLTRLGANADAAIEFESINQKVSRSGKLWVQHIDEDGNAYLITKQDAAALNAPESGVTIADLSEAIPILNKETAEVIRAHVVETGKRTANMRDVRAQQGLMDVKDPEVFRPIRPDLKQYPHFAFVTDPTVTGAGHVTMIHAASEKELTGLLEKVPARYQKLYKTDTEEFRAARQEYEFSRTLNENYINSELAAKGTFSNFFPKSDPQKIINDVLQQNLRESDVTVIEAIRLRYEQPFGLLEDLGQQYSKAATSRFASKREAIEKTTDNPYFNHIKTALDISQLSEHSLLYSFNKQLDEAVSKFTGKVQEAWQGVKSPADLEQINGLLDKYGMKPAYYDSALEALANHQAPKGVLTKFVRQANSLLSLFTLGLDPLNSLNNAVGANILRMTELKHLTRAINAGDSEIAGELGNIAKISLPGTGDQILAPTKLVGAAIQAFWKDDGTLLAKYKGMGLIKDRVEQLKLLVDDVTLKGTETVADLNVRIEGAFAKAKGLTETGEKASGNKLAEEFNRFISANVMDQITTLGKSKGLIDDATSNAYINTFVNRVEGNIISSQRPLVFQGPIGQAVGLFQSYQFNLMQQLFRYVAEGSGKDIAMMAGLQSTLYGIQSLPAFQFVNTHIVGQLSGNVEHRDLYDATYGVAGRTAGDFFLYGIPSNILQANLYTRGDINPRQITILPTSMQEIPIVQGWGKFLMNIKETAGKVVGGGQLWESVLQGMEHNGISRPLAGFAQTLRGIPSGEAFSTQNNGNLLYSNDLYSWASIIRLAGGRPLDEARTNDALFRVKTYSAARSRDMESLGEIVKTTMLGAGEPDQESMNRFAESFISKGGKQAQFNKWITNLYKDTNVTQAEKLRGSLTNPFAYKMQALLGGEEE